jgi:CBS-domain-containing membrane protein
MHGSNGDGHVDQEHYEDGREDRHARRQRGAAARIMARHHCGIVPVVDADGKLCGIVTDRDIFLPVGTRIRYPDELPVGEVMTTKVYAASPDDEASRALDLMKHHAIRRLPVVTANGRVVGIVSLDDLALRPGSHRGAAISEEDLIEAVRAMSVRAVAA